MMTVAVDSCDFNLACCCCVFGGSDMVDFVTVCIMCMAMDGFV